MKPPVAWPTVAVLTLAIALLVVLWRLFPSRPEAMLLAGSVSAVVLSQMQRALGGKP
jgi:hypothetical protein